MTGQHVVYVVLNLSLESGLAVARRGAYFTPSRGSRLRTDPEPDISSLPWPRCTTALRRTVEAVKRQGLEWTFAQSLPQSLGFG